MPETIITTNKRAFHDYEIADKYTAGIKLTGPEVKSVKLGQTNLKGSYATVSASGTPLLVSCHIAPYKPAKLSQTNYDPARSRVLLLSKKEINYLSSKLKEKRYSLLPLEIKNKSGLIKIELGLGRGKKQYEKRALIKKRDIEKEISRLTYS